MSSPRRVTVVAPRARLDVALPLECTVGELIPQLVRLAGAQPQPPGDSPGWGLARVGEHPLAPGLTVTAAAVADGEVLHLRPRARYEAPLLFDDVVDAIASAAETRRGAWRPRVGRRLAIAVAMVLFLGCTLLVLTALSGSPAAPITTGVVAVALLLLGGALARARGDADAGAACAGVGVVAALLAGLVALDSLPVGLGAATLAAALAAVLVGHRFAAFVAAATATGLGALGSAVVVLFDVAPVDVAAVGAVVVTALGAMAPMISLRLARLPLPRVPADMEQFRADERPALGADVLDQTSAAAEMLTGLVSALGAVVAGGCLVLLGSDSVWAQVLAGLLGLAWVLRSRSYAGAMQRVAPVVAGLVVLAGLVLRLASDADTNRLLAFAAGMVVLAAACLWYAERVVRGEHSPSRARWLDVLEYLVLIALLPVAGAIVGVYSALG